MDELKDKIEILQKALKLLNNKQDFFVPSIKSATLAVPKPIKSSPKLPGIAPPSKKDPTKVAEQIKNPRPTKVKVELLKIEKNGQWNLQKEDLAQPTPIVPKLEPRTKPASPTAIATRKTAPSYSASQVNSTLHGAIKNSAAQNSLVHGIDLETTAPVGRGAGEAAFATSTSHPHEVIIKNSTLHPDPKTRGHFLNNNFNSAKREVLYHDLAHDVFGLGEHVPLTAGFKSGNEDWSAQKMLPDANHVKFDNTSGQIIDPHHQETVDKLHNSGQLDKLSMMDHVLGHHDRHTGNFMMGKSDNSLHLIDNGTAFDYNNNDQHDNLHSLHDPSIKGEKFHPEAVKWLNSLSPETAQKVMAEKGYDSNHGAVKGMLSRLSSLKNHVNNSNYTNKVLSLKDQRKATHMPEGSI